MTEKEPVDRSPGTDGTVTPVTVPSMSPWGTTTAYLLSGAASLLVDPASRTDELDAAVDAHEPRHVAVTHAHPDHVDAVAHYASVADATVWCRRGYEARFERATGVCADRTFVEGSTVGPATVLDTPGHAVDHVAFDADGHVVAGDLAVAEGSVMVGAPEGDMRAYLVALRRLYARNPESLHPAHGGPIADPRATLARLVDHRRRRETRVLAAVEDGATTVESVLDAAYEKDISSVRGMARATVRAHLEKLGRERRVRLDGDRVEPY